MCYLLTILLKFVRKSAILSYSLHISRQYLFSAYICNTAILYDLCMFGCMKQSHPTLLILQMLYEANQIIGMWSAPLSDNVYYMTNHTFYISLRSSTKFGVMFHSVELWLNKLEVLICVNITFIKLKLS